MLRWEKVVGPLHEGLETEWGFLGTVQVAAVHLNASRADNDLERMYAGSVLLPGFTVENRRLKGPNMSDIKERIQKQVSMWCEAAGVAFK